MLGLYFMLIIHYVSIRGSLMYVGGVSVIWGTHL